MHIAAYLAVCNVFIGTLLSLMKESTSVYVCIKNLLRSNLCRRFTHTHISS
ncbi:hypothetical protein HMPREF3232_00866 [Fannyhessea vaginae]|nr:hypothetical protein HMPREF3232_00866 [Fannyhessea vaginae]